MNTPEREHAERLIRQARALEQDAAQRILAGQVLDESQREHLINTLRTASQWRSEAEHILNEYPDDAPWLVHQDDAETVLDMDHHPSRYEQYERRSREADEAQEARDRNPPTLAEIRERMRGKPAQQPAPTPIPPAPPSILTRLLRWIGWRQ